jgi:hypothetical protein
VSIQNGSLRSLLKHYLVNSAPIRHVYLSKQSYGRLPVDSFPVKAKISRSNGVEYCAPNLGRPQPRSLQRRTPQAATIRMAIPELLDPGVSRLAGSRVRAMVMATLVGYAVNPREVRDERHRSQLADFHHPDPFRRVEIE